MSNVDLFSICATRTLLELGCRQCLRRKECVPFKFEHNGLSPYEYRKESEEVKDNEETK